MVLGLGYPSFPQDPGHKGRDAAPADDGHGRDALAKDGAEEDDEDDDGADVLQDDGRVGDEGPEIVRLEPRVALQVLEKSSLIGVVVRVYRVEILLALSRIFAID